MNKEDLQARINVLEDEIDSTEQELKFLLEDVNELYNQLDELKVVTNNAD